MQLETWDYPTATPPRKELVLIDNETLVARIDCDFVGDNPYILTKDQAFKYGSLFAAAPDLLEALQKTTAWLDNLHAKGEFSSKINVVIENARDAIAKAMGVQQ